MSAARPAVGTLWRQLDELARRRSALFVLAGLVALGVYSLGLSVRLGNTPLFFVVPIALGALDGVVAGIAVGLVSWALMTGWWFHDREPQGVGWVLSRGAIFIALGSLLGWLAASRQRLARQIAHERDLSPDLIATASFDGFLTDVNAAFSRTLGYTREQLLARPFLDFVHPHDRMATRSAKDGLIDGGGELVSFQNRCRCADGSYRWLEWSSRPEAKSRTLAVVGRDVTDRKRLEEQEHRYQERLEREVAERTQALEESRRETVARLALAAEYRDDGTERHNARVSETSAQIAVVLGLDAHTVALVREAALLHDVGKVGVSDALLLKPGQLTDAEFADVKQHAEIGAAILSGSTSEVLRISEAVALSHHERWDGSGYPNGLIGDAIPLAARIVAVADVFDALTHTRPYKRASTVEVAVAELHRLAGSEFDPVVIAAFDRLDAHALAGQSLGEACEPPETAARPSQAARTLVGPRAARSSNLAR